MVDGDGCSAPVGRGIPPIVVPGGSSGGLGGSGLTTWAVSVMMMHDCG